MRASIGLCDNLLYENLSIGNSLTTLLKILEGKHTFCKNLRKAKKPTIILGASIKKRLDCLSAFQLLRDLNRYTKILLYLIIYLFKLCLVTNILHCCDVFQFFNLSKWFEDDG